MSIEALNVLTFAPKPNIIDHAWQETPQMVVVMPELQDLRPIPDSLTSCYPDHEEVKPVIGVLRPTNLKKAYPTVEVDLKLESNVEASKLIIFPDRRKLVVLHYHRWRTNEYTSMQECFDGPYKPDDYCIHAVSQAFPLAIVK